MDRLAVAHRWLGFATVWLIAAHGVLTTTGYAMGDGAGVVDELAMLLTTYPYVLWATAGFGLFVAGRRQLRPGRPAPALVRDLVRPPPLRLPRHRPRLPAPAVRRRGLHARPARRALLDRPVRRHRRAGADLPGRAARSSRPCVTGSASPRSSTEAEGVVSVYLAGRDLDRLAVRSGQYFVIRFLTRDGWWRAHPFSISSAPNGRWLRFTVKDLGDDSRRIGAIPVGTRVFVEGPYGMLTGARRTRRGVTLIAGGIGITPLRALLESLPGEPGDLTLIYRATTARSARVPDGARHAGRAPRRAGPLPRRIAAGGGARTTDGRPVARRRHAGAAGARRSPSRTSTCAGRRA